MLLGVTLTGGGSWDAPSSGLVRLAGMVRGVPSTSIDAAVIQPAGVSVISAISGVEKSLIGGPQNPVPRCA